MRSWKLGGVVDLRVADYRVMPTLNRGHTQIPSYGIGEKCRFDKGVLEKD